VLRVLFLPLVLLGLHCDRSTGGNTPDAATEAGGCPSVGRMGAVFQLGQTCTWEGACTALIGTCSGNPLVRVPLRTECHAGLMQVTAGPLQAPPCLQPCPSFADVEAGTLCSDNNNGVLCDVAIPCDGTDASVQTCHCGGLTEKWVCPAPQCDSHDGGGPFGDAANRRDGE
jgi:hypothetical protein